MMNNEKVNISQMRKYRTGRPLRNMSAVDIAFAVALFVYIATSEAGAAGASLLVAFLAIELAYIAATDSFRLYPSLLVFTGVGVLYIFLSYANELPNAWTRFYSSDAILQQSSFVLLLYPSVLAGRRFWRTVFTKRQGKMMLYGLCIAGGVVSPLLSRFYWDIPDPFYMLHTPIAFLGAAAMVLLLRAPRLMQIAGILAIGGLAGIAGESVQIKIIGIASVIVVLTPWPRLIALLVCSALAMAATIGQWYVWQLWLFYHDFGIRLIFARDAVQAIKQTFGLGIGFGKEAIKNFYPFLHDVHWDLKTQFHDFLFTMVHNSFLGVPLRIGLVGGLAFFWFVVITARPPRGVPLPMSRLASLCYIAAFINLFSDVGIESPTFSIGVCYLLALTMYIGEAMRRTRKANWTADLWHRNSTPKDPRPGGRLPEAVAVKQMSVGKIGGPSGYRSA